MNEAATALENTLVLEVKKDALKQLQSGEWTLALKVNAEDMQKAVPLMKAPMGTRYKCVLVELNEDETPVVQKKPKERQKFDTLPLSQQAALLCQTPGFWKFLTKFYHVNFLGNSFDNDIIAADFIRNHCGVKSRATLDTNREPAAKFLKLNDAYDKWPGFTL